MTRHLAFLITCSYCSLLLLLQTTCISAFHVVSYRSRSSLTELLSESARDGRREFLVSATISLAFLGAQSTKANAESSSPSLSELLSLLKEARSQLDAVPKLIETEKWDSVRAILIKPPLSDCWTKTTRPILPLYAEAIGNTANGDELAALEGKEELISHLRYLDMSVYNNNFNPIKSEGTNGASKELVRSYYEDPTNEWKASIQALDDLLQLAGDVK